MKHVVGPGGRMPAVHLLSNGRYGVLLDDSGGGYSAFNGFALTRWDPAGVVGGCFLYVRDLDSGARWSAGYEPLATAPATYRVDFGGGRATFGREDDGVSTCTEVCVAPDGDVELRAYRLTNRCERPRRLELTTYAEVILDVPASAAGHPAFSSLFVQTGYLPERQALLAWRRPRSAADVPLWLGHRLLIEDAPDAEPGYETDRARFLGRGRTPAEPIALDCDARLSGTVGNVLDPVLSMRRSVELAPGEAVTVCALLAAAHQRQAVEALLDRYADAGVRRDAFERARPAPPGSRAALGLPESWFTGSRAVLSPPESWSAGALDALGSPEQRLAAERVGVIDPIAGRTMAGSHSRTRPLFPRDGRVGTSGSAGSGAGAAGVADVDENAESLLYFNGLGGFSADGSEYVIRLEHGPDGLRLPPVPWVNVVANEEIGFIVSERGAGCTWAANSRENRLTPWFNDPVSDPHGEALYIRDDESGEFWSPAPGPVPGAGAYEVRHGFGYTRFRNGNGGIEQDVWQFVARRDPVKFVRVRVTNRGPHNRRLSLFSYAELVLGAAPAATRGCVVTEHDQATGAILARNRARGDFAGRVAFATMVSADRGPVRSTADRTAFLGEGGRVTSPAALRSAEPLGGSGAAVARADISAETPGAIASGRAPNPAAADPDPCVAFQLQLEVAPGETVECAFLLGEAVSADAARAVLRRYGDVAAIDAALEDARAHWRDLLSAVRIRTPSPAIDLMVNGWLSYQNLSCRVWGRTAFYQSGGAFGFRDQLQDASALVYLDPRLTRRQILLHAAHQFVEGDVMHWWHPPTSKGIRTRFSDDLLWLPYITLFYVQRTGDNSVLDEEVRFLAGRALELGEDEAFLVPSDAGESGSVYEHCCRALDRSLTRGERGLPLMGSGDWNDGMNSVGRAGRGESVWLGFFLFEILDDFISICDRRGDAGRAARYRDHRRQLARALNDAGWDGAWYRRAYYDDGSPLGSAANDECRIDALAQAWAVISGAAPAERADRSLDAMEEHLVSESDGLIRLLAPPFDGTAQDPGYIKGYLPGVRENGGQYTHAAVWAVRALAEAGRNDRAARLLEMLSPVSRAATRAGVAVYRAEPYVVAADVYGSEPHIGRGGWSWYTGSAGWMYRVALESILGLDLRHGQTLALRPCIPDEWPGYSVSYRLPDGGAVYEIEVRRAEDGAGITLATVDGEPAAVDDGAVIIPLAADGAVHRVEVQLARDLEVVYASRLARVEAEGREAVPMPE